MSLEVVVPEVSDGVTSGTVIDLAVAVGDQVEADQTLLELETDKAVVSIPSPAKGRVSEIRVAEGDTAKVGTVIMLLDEDSDQSTAESQEPETGEQSSHKASDKGAQKDGDKETQETHSEAEVEDDSSTAEAHPPREGNQSSKQSEAPQTDQVDLSSIRRDQQVAPAAPSVRRMSRELGVDIYQVKGSGPGGRISKEDVQRFVRQTMQQPGRPDAALNKGGSGSVQQQSLPDFSKWGEVERLPQSRIRQVTAAAMAYSWATIPMVTQYDKVSVTALEGFRKDFNSSAAAADKLTVTAFLAKVCGIALQVFPQFNSSLDQEAGELVVKHYINIGVAVDTPGGLLVPVLKGVDDKGIETIASELNELAERTRKRRIDPAEMEGGTFTISNLGGIGGTHFTPLVYAPQVAILGVGQARVEPVWNGQEFSPETVVTLALTYDHRVIDGADGARFLRWICAALENPWKLMMQA